MERIKDNGTARCSSTGVGGGQIKDKNISCFIVEVMLTLKDRRINMSRASDGPKSKRIPFTLSKIHNAYCIIPSALCRIQLQLSWL